VISGVNVHGLVGAFWPVKACGRPWGNVKEARDQTQWVPEEEQTLTGWLNVTTVATGTTGPAAQLGLQASSL
jgi:hypothetical protein